MEKTEQQHKRGKVSKWTVGLAALSIVGGLCWTVSSGFTDIPSEVVTSDTNIQMAVPYRGLCSDVVVRVDSEQKVLSATDIRGGLAKFAFQLDPGEHDVELEFSGIIPGLEKTYPLSVTVDQTIPELEAKLGEEEFGARDLHLTTSSFELTGKTEPGALLSLENEAIAINEDGSFEQKVSLESGWNHLLVTASDRAGNKKQVRQSVFSDIADPEIKWITTPDKKFDKRKIRVELKLTDDGQISGVSGKVDKNLPITWHAKENDLWVGDTPELHEGFHEVTVLSLIHI